MRRLRDGGDYALPPVMEMPSPEEFVMMSVNKHRPGCNWSYVMKHWMSRKGQIEKSASSPHLSTHVKRSDVQLLLGILGCPLVPRPPTNHTSSPFHISLVKDTPMDACSAQYIVQQYVASSGAGKLPSNFYALGQVRMVASEFEPSCGKVSRTRNPAKVAEAGCFVLWQMMPDMWCMELAMAGSKIRAGSNGKLMWRQSPWLGSHKVKGPVRPLRRALQGLDPWMTARIFLGARCIGEKNMGGHACFVLKLIADPPTLSCRSNEGPVEIIRHVMLGYFSQKTGLLVHLEDSQLLRIQSSTGDTIYWETSMESWLEDYRPVEGVNIAHSGRTVLNLFRFGETATSHTRTRLEETWNLEEVAFNVPGVSTETFIPPTDLKEDHDSFSELTREGEEKERGGSGSSSSSRPVNTIHPSRVAALEKLPNLIVWRPSAEIPSIQHPLYTSSSTYHPWRAPNKLSI